MFRRPLRSTLFPYTTLFRSSLHQRLLLVGQRAFDRLPDPLLRNLGADVEHAFDAVKVRAEGVLDRKSTRLNSSHANISYAVFCLKKKKKRRIQSTEYNMQIV